MADNKGSGDTQSAANGERSQSHHGNSETTESRVVDQAVKGFGSNGNNYDAFRPGYTEEAVQIIADAVTLGRSTLSDQGISYHVLELGAGTGKLTQQLVALLPGGTRYMATEPSRNFLDTLEGKGLGVDPVVASADNLPLPDASVQTVVCGQCFHWFAEAANLASIRRVMVPGGKLIMVWNVNNMEDEWMKPMGDQRKRVIESVGGSLKHLVNTGEWRRDIDTSPLFCLHKYLNLSGNNVVGDLERIMSNISTISAYNMLSEQDRKSCLDELRALISNWPGVDVKNITMDMSTLLVIYEAK